MNDELKQKFTTLFEEFSKKYTEFIHFQKSIKKFNKDTNSITNLMLTFTNDYANLIEDRINMKNLIITEHDINISIFAGMLKDFVENKCFILDESTNLIYGLQDTLSSAGVELQKHIGDKNTTAKYKIFERELDKVIKSFETRTRELKTKLAALKKDYKKLLKLYNTFIN